MEQALGGLIHPEMTGLIALVFALGLRHGFDPDHLVAIDGLTRSSARVRPGMSRWSGLFFSLGHGAVVTLVGLGVAVAPHPLVREDLKLGRLVAPFGFVKSGQRYCLLHPAELVQAGKVRTFRRWIEKAARARS